MGTLVISYGRSCLECAIIREQDVLELEVTMDDAQRVEIFKREENLRGVEKLRHSGVPCHTPNHPTIDHLTTRALKNGVGLSTHAPAR